MTSSADLSTSLEQVLRRGEVTSVYQPIVDLATGQATAFEALARGPVGPWQSPAVLFATARAEGRLAELDEACGAAAFAGAVRHGLVSPTTVFVNVEPEVLEAAPLHALAALAAQVPEGLSVVLEITERALSARPAELLQSVERVRDLGWGVALDDVGAETASLAFMPLLRPDVVKLDLRLVQGRPDPAIAQIMNAVNAYAESTGAVVLAEGIETEEHLAAARGLGATLGQGWYFGRPTATPDPALVTGVLRLPRRDRSSRADQASPFACLPERTQLRVAPKRLLVELSKQLEREAMRVGETCVVASTFQHVKHFTPATIQRYRDLVDRTALTCAIGEGLEDQPVPGLRGAGLEAGDPVLGEWDVAVVGPHFSAALLARDLGDSGPDMKRRFEYALTYERDTVVAATRQLLSRVAPREDRPARLEPDVAQLDLLGPVLPELVGGSAAAPWIAADLDGDGLLDRALAASSNGITIADMTRPDQPLVYVNPAFAALAGMPAEDLIGRNCRFLQAPDTDRDAVDRVRAAISEGRSCREVLLNVRGPDREVWWNEVTLSPVRDTAGNVVRYIGVQNDVTARLEAERALERETHRARAYLDRIESLAWTDPLTGLLNRRRLEQEVETQLWEARASDSALALLFLDLDGFKDVNDSLGHAVGDEVLQEIAARLRRAIRKSDLVARLGGDEFLVAVTGLDRGDARARAAEIADVVTHALGAPVAVRGTHVTVSASVGVSIYPEDGTEFGRLLHLADMRMYDLKHPTHEAGSTPA